MKPAHAKLAPTPLRRQTAGGYGSFAGTTQAGGKPPAPLPPPSCPQSYTIAPVRSVPPCWNGRACYRELPRIPILRRWVSKDHHVRLRLLVNEEHAPAKLVRCSPYAGLGAQILRSTIFEDLVCVGKLAGRECFTSARCHHDAHGGLGTSGPGNSPPTKVPPQRCLLRRPALPPGGRRSE